MGLARLLSEHVSNSSTKFAARQRGVPESQRTVVQQRDRLANGFCCRDAERKIGNNLSDIDG